VKQFDAIKEQVRQAVNIVDVVAEHITLRSAGKEFKGLCPFHQDSKPSLTVNAAKQIFKCFACGAGGDVFAFVQRRENVGFVEALTILADRAGIRWEPRSDGSSEHGIDRSELVKINGWARDRFRSHLRAEIVGDGARNYLARRGISEEMWEAFQIGLAVDSYEDLLQAARRKGIEEKLLAAVGLVKVRQGAAGYYDTFRNRLMFPIGDATSRTIGFGGRTLGDDPAKYLNTPETLLFDKGRHLYGLDRARRTVGDRGRAIIVEGYTDCVMAHQFGFTETVATLGTAMTEAHSQLIRRYTSEVVLLFDSDEAGRKAADRALAAALGGLLSVRVASVPQGKDPCDYLLAAGAEAFAAVIDSAVDAFEYKWRQIHEAHHAGESATAKRAAIESFMEAVAAANRSGVVDEIGRGLLLNRLSPLLGLPADALHRLLASRPSRKPQPAGAVPPLGGGDRSVRRPSGDAEQAALQEMLEILINESGAYVEIKEHFRPERFADKDLALIAQGVRDLAERLGEFTLVELLGWFQDPRFGDRVTDLQMNGERGGRFRERLMAAVETLERVERSRQASQAGRSLMDKLSQGERGETVDEALRRVHAKAHDQHHFAPRKALKQV
jgi:DNA primase